MATLKETLLEKIQEHRPRTQKLVKEHGDVKIGEVTIGQAIGGARGVRMPGDRHLLPRPVRGHPLPRQDHPGDVRGAPQGPGSRVSLRRGVLVVPAHRRRADGCSRPSRSSQDFKTRRQFPIYVIDVLRAMPRDTHPMTMFSAAILVDAAGVDVRQALQRRG